MELYDVINGFSALVKDGILVLHRSMTEHPKFKVYKDFNYNLYHIVNKEKKLLLSTTVTKNTPIEKIEEVWSKTDKDFMITLAKYLLSDEFKGICNV